MKILLVLLSLIWMGSFAEAQTGSNKTTSALNAEVNALWPDNFTGAITPFNARQTLLDMIASAGVLSTANSWTALQTFGAATFTGIVTASQIQPSIIYSAAGTPLPACNSGSNGQSAIVSDATGATYAAAYTSGGAQTRRVLCINGTGWVTN